MKGAESAISAATTETVRRKLRQIETQHSARVLFAVESGSRAWGFPSPDSDYDIRFVYRHERDWYLSLVDRRDVIELPLDEDGHDISGWDLRKALQLFMKSNPPLYEWLVSPHVYLQAGDLAPVLREIAVRRYSRQGMGWHYFSMARRTHHTHFVGKSQVSLKKYFYVIRPLCALLWLQRRQGLPPMNLQALLAGLDLPNEVRLAIDRLLEAKRRTSEMGKDSPVQVLEDWIASRLSDETQVTALPASEEGTISDLEALFRRTIEQPLA
jgi:predicted nucleotidyltransferase